MQRNKRRIIAVKKCHKVKNNVICDKTRRILFLSKTYGGSRHDKAIIDEEGWKLPKGIVVHEDSGFQGHEQKGVVISRPLRKPRGRKLTKKQRAANRSKAKQRVKVEHAIGYVKIYRMVKDCIRINKDKAKDRVMEICCALANLKIQYKN